VAGLRYDTQKGYHGRTTPRVAVLYHPNANGALKVLYGEAFRVPTPWERDYDDGSYLSNPDLEDEKIRTTELVWEQRLTPEVLAIVSLYRYRVDGLIEGQLVSEDPWLSQFVNRGSVSSRGVEAELSYRSARGLWTFVHYSHQQAEENGEWLTNSPKNILTAGASSPIGSRLTGALEVLHESGRRTLFDTSTEAWTVANVTATARIGFGLKAVAQLRNAFDTRYSYPGGIEHRQAAIEQDGRTFLLRLVYQY
jgi:iron complex outermembrane receptor protein